MADFVHLHNHTDYSLLDASQTVEQMCNRVYDLGMDSIAVTDHGNLFAMIPFYKQAQKSKGRKTFKSKVLTVVGARGLGLPGCPIPYAGMCHF